MRHTNRTVTSVIAIGALTALTALTGCGGGSSKTAGSTTTTATAAADSATPAGASGAADDFCVRLDGLVQGLAALGSGAATSNPTQASGLFKQAADRLDQLATGAPNGLGPDLSTMATTFRKGSDALVGKGTAGENVFADKDYLAASKNVVGYYTGTCQAATGS